MTLRRIAILLVLLLPALAAPAPAAGPVQVSPATVVRAVAVAETPEGLRGSIATISISHAENGTGLLFMDTQPYTQVDIQGSARLAVRVAGTVTGLDVARRDVFLVVRSEAPIIGGPSAGAVMAVGAIAALKGWAIRGDVLMTGTVNPDGSVGPVGGVPEKARAAAEVGATTFLYPVGQEVSVLATPQGAAYVEVDRYCSETLRITCAAVADVEAAVTYFTGYSFARPVPTGEVQSAQYESLMRPLGESEVNRSSAALAGARAKLAAATRAPAQARADLGRQLDDADATVAGARAALGERHYYTASSRSYQAALEARRVNHTVEYYEAADRPVFLSDLLDSADATALSTQAMVSNATIRGLSNLEAVGAAQVRSMEALGLASQARTAATGGDVGGALDAAAVTIERAGTARWWLRIAGKLETGDPYPAAELRTRAREALTVSTQLVAYVDSTLQSAGLANGAAQALALLSRAEEDLERGLDAAALFDAYEAQMRAALALETASYRNGVPDARLERARTSALQAIAEARSGGAEPVLAISYFEFAGDLPAGTDRLAFYDLARVIGRGQGSLRLDRTDQPTESVFVGSPADPGSRSALDRLAGADALLPALLLYLAVATAVTLLLTMRRPKPSAPAPSGPVETPPPAPASVLPAPTPPIRPRRARSVRGKAPPRRKPRSAPGRKRS